MDLSLAGAVVVALFLAILFETFTRGPSDRDGTPFNSGLNYSNRRLNDWLAAVQYAVFLLWAAAALILVLVDAGEPVVIGAVTYMFVLVSMRHTLWALRVSWPNWYHDHPDGILNGVFAIPLTLAAAATMIVAVS